MFAAWLRRRRETAQRQVMLALWVHATGADTELLGTYMGYVKPSMRVCSTIATLIDLGLVEAIVFDPEAWFFDPETSFKLTNRGVQYVLKKGWA